MLEFDARVSGGEAPIDGRLLDVAVVPTVTAPKLIPDGAKATFVPVPVSMTTCGLPASESLMVTAP